MEVALAGLITGGTIALAFTSLSTDLDFVAIILASIALAVFASSIRALRDETDSADDPRNAAALPLDRLPLVGSASAGSSPTDDEPGRREPPRRSDDDSESHTDAP